MHGYNHKCTGLYNKMINQASWDHLPEESLRTICESKYLRNNAKSASEQFARKRLLLQLFILDLNMSKVVTTLIKLNKSHKASRTFMPHFVVFYVLLQTVG